MKGASKLAPLLSGTIPFVQIQGRNDRATYCASLTGCDFGVYGRFPRWLGWQADQYNLG